MTRHRVVVLPWLRPLGRVLLPNWLAITLGRTILTWRALTAPELAHELEHVRQWERFGIAFPFAYLAESYRARRAGGRWYGDNRFEAAARRAAQDVEPR